MTRIVAVVLVLLSSWGCGLLGPSCLARQERGTVATISGDIGPGQVRSHQVRYATEGSQNDVQVGWTGQSTAGGPRISVYATKVGCADFRPPPAPNDSSCAVIGRAGATDGFIVTTLTITSGRGNPDTLGSAAEYILWVIGDPQQSAAYTLDITWFFGPDC